MIYVSITSKFNFEHISRGIFSYEHEHEIARILHIKSRSYDIENESISYIKRSQEYHNIPCSYKIQMDVIQGPLKRIAMTPHKSIIKLKTYQIKRFIRILSKKTKRALLLIKSSKKYSFSTSFFNKSRNLFKFLSSSQNLYLKSKKDSIFLIIWSYTTMYNILVKSSSKLFPF